MGSRKKKARRLARPARSIATTVEHLGALERLVGGDPVWRSLDKLRAVNGGAVTWPDWCLLPMAATVTFANTYGSPPGLDPVDYAALLSALYAWRQGRGIYRFDAELASALIATDGRAKVPTSVFYQLPEWGLYLDLVSLHGCQLLNDAFVGCFVYLEYDYRHDESELRLLIDGRDGGWLAVSLHITGDSVTDMLRASAERTYAEAKAAGDHSYSHLEVVAGMQALAPHVTPIVSLLLYLCSLRPDVCDPDRPGTTPTRTTPTTGNVREREWQVGYRTSTILRQSRLQASTHAVRAHATVAPHLRRAHWQTYYTGVGSKSDPTRRVPVLRWIPPTLVNAEIGSPHTTSVKRVRH